MAQILPLNQFDEATRLLFDENLVTRRTSRALYHQLLLGSHEPPSSDFNVPFFFTSIARTLTDIQSGKADRETSVNAVQIPPHGAFPHALYPEFAQRYTELVRAELSPDDSSFDVGYALNTVATALQPETLDWILNPDPSLADPFESLLQGNDILWTFEPKSEEDYDDWLAGFNTH